MIPRTPKAGPQQGSGFGRKSQTMCIIHNQDLLVRTAQALLVIEQAGEIPVLLDELKFAYRSWKQEYLNRSVGENFCISHLVRILTDQGVDRQLAWAAVSDAVRPSRATAMCEAIIRFAAQLPSTGRQCQCAS